MSSNISNGSRAAKAAFTKNQNRGRSKRAAHGSKQKSVWSNHKSLFVLARPQLKLCLVHSSKLPGNADNLFNQLWRLTSWLPFTHHQFSVLRMTKHVTTRSVSSSMI